MKRAILFLAIGGILAATLCISPAAAGGSNDIEKLKKEIDALRARVESLEKRLDEQSQAMPKTRVMPLTTIDPNRLLLRSIPRDWTQFEFNGRPVYVIPLQSGSPVKGGSESDRK